MDYTPEEISFVRFCSEQDGDVICKRGRKKKCPAQGPSCDTDEPPCAQMVAMMERGEELSDEYVNVIRFWMRELDWGDDCIPDSGEDPCPNIEHCVEGTEVCEGLLRKLGVYEPYEYELYEKDIQEVIVKDLKNAKINWYMAEALQYLKQKPRIDVGEPDILLKGVESKKLYVVELKVVEASRDDVGQLASYVGWYREHPEDCDGCKDVEGILLAPSFSKKAEYALKACNNLVKRRFDLHVEIIKPLEQVA